MSRELKSGIGQTASLSKAAAAIGRVTLGFAIE